MLSEQYANIVIVASDGRVTIGRIAEETSEKVVIKPNPLEPETVSIDKSDIESRKLSNISPMPAGLLNTFSELEILDLLAYLESLGNSKHPNFQ